MRLKYFMRGIGIGIILTALILSIGNPKEKLTDQEIITRAKALGMIDGKDNNSDLDKVLQGIKPSSGPSSAPTQEPTPAPTQKLTPVPTQGTTPVPTQEPTPAPTQEQFMPTLKPTDIPAVTIIPVTDHGNSDISFTIKRGMSSDKVAKLLKEAGLIENADEFNQYMESNGKASIIKVGTYSLPKGATFEEIVRKITSK